MARLPKLSPTSYALLGLLARGPMSAYELNQAMQVSIIRPYWPRAESHVYSEPKKLVAHGFVEVSERTRNGRNSSVYTITGAGQAALVVWLAEPGDSTMRLQSEFMLKLVLVNAGDPKHAWTLLEAAERACLADIQTAIAGIEGVLSRLDAIHHSLPWNGMAMEQMADLLQARLQWVRGVRARLAEHELDEPPRELGVQAYEQALAKLRGALAQSQ